MSSDSTAARTNSMNSQTVSFSANPVVSAVAAVRALDSDLPPRRAAIREAGRRQVAALMASGAYSLDPSRRV